MYIIYLSNLSSLNTTMFCLIIHVTTFFQLGQAGDENRRMSPGHGLDGTKTIATLQGGPTVTSYNWGEITPLISG